MGMLDDAVLRARLRPAGDLILFRKALLSLEGVLADVCSDVRIDDLLPWIFLRKLAGEWPRRLITSPLSRKLWNPSLEPRSRLLAGAVALDAGPRLARKRSGTSQPARSGRTRRRRPPFLNSESPDSISAMLLDFASTREGRRKSRPKILSGPTTTRAQR